MTIRDLYGQYTDVQVEPETWAQLYQSGLIRNGVLDMNQIERNNDNGYHGNFNHRDSNQVKY